MINSPTPNPQGGKIFAGLVLLAIGLMLLLKNAGLHFSFWFINWEMIVMALGLFMGIRSNFRHPAWFILLTVGGLNLIENYNEDFNVGTYLWPMLLIEFGLWMIFGRQRRHISQPHYNSFNPEAGAVHPPQDLGPAPFDTNPADVYPDQGPVNGMVSPHDYLNVTAVLGGSKKIVVSKNFQGGEIITFMGGSEVNLIQADIQGQAVLDITQVMGGTKLIVPANWTVISEITVLMGGIDDKRMMVTPAPNKVLVLKGTSVMGGVAIHSY
ncbi:MAG: LiaF transmembrane domain-containing protein [Adhaeribacter sp.]